MIEDLFDCEEMSDRMEIHKSDAGFNQKWYLFIFNGAYKGPLEDKQITFIRPEIFKIHKKSESFF